MTDIPPPETSTSRFWRSTGHLGVLLALLIVAGTGFALARRQFVPETYGQNGPYRGAALAEAAALPSVLHTDSDCLSCHDDVRQERAGAMHESVDCVHCHGLGREHIVQARKAAESPGSPIDPALPWDGDFRTKIDLYLTKDRAVCLTCHESKVGMPSEFKQIVVATHLEEMGASDPADRQVCFECHGGHNTAP